MTPPQQLQPGRPNQRINQLGKIHQCSNPQRANSPKIIPVVTDTFNPRVGHYIYMYIKHGEKKFCGNAFEKAI